MTEYKENTVGWHLSRLKEPLRSRALTNTLEEKALAAPIAGMWEAIHLAFPWSDTPEGQGFWAGVHNFFQGQGRKPNRRAGVAEGWDMAKECAPDPEMVNPPLDLVSTGLGVMDTGNHPRLENFMKGMGADTPIPPMPPFGPPAGAGEYPFTPDDVFIPAPKPKTGDIMDNPCPDCWYGSHDHSGPLVCTGKCAMVPLKVVEGYTPPRPVSQWDSMTAEEVMEFWKQTGMFPPIRTEEKGRHDRELKEQAARIAALEAQVEKLTNNLEDAIQLIYSKTRK